MFDLVVGILVSTSFYFSGAGSWAEVIGVFTV